MKWIKAHPSDAVTEIYVLTDDVISPLHAR